MRSRLPEVGSFNAQTTNEGAFAFGSGRSPPMGTPFAYPVLTQSFCLATSGAYSQPPKNRMRICGPLVAKVSLRCIASNSEARVFSSAHTPVRPAGFS